MKPSLTELLSILDKPALINWANKQGLKGIDISKERQKWLNSGISIHNQIENYIKNKTPFLNKIDEEKYLKFISDKEIINIEKSIETEYFIGRYDLLVKWKNNLCLIDFKNNQKNIYFENKLQLVGYSMAEKCDKLFIVGVPNFDILEVKINDKKPYEEILKALSIIYLNKKLISHENNTTN